MCQAARWIRNIWCGREGFPGYFRNWLKIMSILPLVIDEGCGSKSNFEILSTNLFVVQCDLSFTWLECFESNHELPVERIILVFTSRKFVEARQSCVCVCAEIFVFWGQRCQTSFGGPTHCKQNPFSCSQCEGGCWWTWRAGGGKNSCFVQIYLCWKLDDEAKFIFKSPRGPGAYFSFSKALVEVCNVGILIRTTKKHRPVLRRWQCLFFPLQSQILKNRSKGDNLGRPLLVICILSQTFGDSWQGFVFSSGILKMSQSAKWFCAAAPVEQDHPEHADRDACVLWVKKEDGRGLSHYLVELGVFFCVSVFTSHNQSQFDRGETNFCPGHLFLEPSYPIDHHMTLGIKTSAGHHIFSVHVWKFNLFHSCECLTINHHQNVQNRSFFDVLLRACKKTHVTTFSLCCSSRPCCCTWRLSRWPSKWFPTWNKNPPKLLRISRSKTQGTGRSKTSQDMCTDIVFSGVEWEIYTRAGSRVAL